MRRRGPVKDRIVFPLDVVQRPAQVPRQTTHEIAPRTAPTHRPHARYRLGQAAGNEKIEHLEVNIDIEGEAVPRNAPPHRNTDCRHLALRRPDAGETCSKEDLQPLFDESAGERPFESAQIAPRRNPAAAQVDDRVADDLPRPMIGRATAAIRVDESHAAALELGRRNSYLSLPPTAAHSHHRWVLQQEQLIGATRSHGTRRRALQRAGIRIALPAEATNAQLGHRVTDRRGTHRLQNDAPS